MMTTTSSWQLTMTFGLVAIFIVNLDVANADTRVLNNINISDESSSRIETIAVENEKDLVVKGTYQLEFAIPSDSENILKSIIDYVADKYGNRVKVTLTKEPVNPAVSLSSASLKSLAG